MSMQFIDSAQHKDRIYKWLVIAVIALGMWLRFWAYVSNRSVILDEANVVLNLHHRSYFALLQPLDYNQYAPPGFLWLQKLLASLLSYSEYALRLWPMLCGVASLYVMYKVLLRLTSKLPATYALWLLATGYIYLYYSTCIKQYSPDVLFVLTAIWLALKTDITQTHRAKFIATWAAAGCMIWFSMPLVFVLAGIACYYLFIVMKQRSKADFMTLFAVYAVWVVQFGMYYFLLLCTQVGSAYLQDFHRDYFSVLLPVNASDWNHNGKLYGDILASCTGNSGAAFGLHISLLITALVYLFIKAKEKFLLFVIPIICLYLASGLHLFTLLPRVALFITPLLLLLIAIGIDVILRVKMMFVKISVAGAFLFCAYDYSALSYIYKPLKHEEFKDGMEYALKHDITGRHFHVNDLIENILFYYTDVHPDKQHWAPLKNAELLPMYGGDIAWRASRMTHDVVVYEWFPDDLLQRDMAAYNKYCNVAKLDLELTNVYLCTRK
jgi:4-amino-4-deoxy-L-arabinose transferase-like glycosyltransferase